MKFKRVKRIKYLEVYYHYDYPYCELLIKSLPYKFSNESKCYYISIKSEDVLIYDSIRDDNKIYMGLDDVKKGILDKIKSYRDFDGIIEIE